MVGGAGVNVSHELMHRTGTRAPGSRAAGCWPSPATRTSRSSISMAITAMYAPRATLPRRGAASTCWPSSSAPPIGQAVSAFRIEAERLTRKGQAFWSRHNIALRGQLMSLALAAAAWWLADGRASRRSSFWPCRASSTWSWSTTWSITGWCARPARASSRATLELLQRHLQRRALQPAAPLQPPHVRHEALLGARGRRPTRRMLPYGYKTMIVMSLFPPIWNRIVEPRVADWDRRFASEEERRILSERGRLTPMAPRSSARSSRDFARGSCASGGARAAIFPLRRTMCPAAPLRRDRKRHGLQDRQARRPLRPQPAGGPERARDHRPRRARAQPEERRPHHSPRQARRVHRAFGVGQVLARLRHDLRGRPAALCGVALGLRPASSWR